jgi:hypothetical protein
MNGPGTEIEGHLAEVAAQRRARERDPALAARVLALKDYQHRRFQHTYADLLAQPRYASAAGFFLDELYGPHDFGERDAQFARIVPALVRLFPSEIVSTVAALARLHALTEQMDTGMASRLPDDAVTATAYAAAWRDLGRQADRERQIELMRQIGAALDRYTANPVLRHSLRLMRKPARAAGLGALQQFLERGFDTFRDLRGADDFLRTISQRESERVQALFDAAAPIPEDFFAAQKAGA